MTNPDILKREKGSFRDRNNQVFKVGERVFRGISEKALGDWYCLEKSAVLKKYSASGNIIGSRLLDTDAESTVLQTDANNWHAWLEHECIPFINYPYEWCFEMLKDAALLHLNLLEAGLHEGITIKDASAFNIQFVGSCPTFIDIPSFEKYQSGTPWLGFRQFCQHFLYPLMLQSYKKISFRNWQRGNVEGITPYECSQLMSLRDMFRPGVFPLVYLQSKMVAALGDKKTSMLAEAQEGEFGREIIYVNIRKVRRIIERLTWEPSRSEWSEYTSTNSYDRECFDRKCAFVKEAAAQKCRNRVWDIGCNTGHFSRMFSENSDYVVALDIDELSIQKLYRQLKAEGNRKILPLVFDLTNPSPGLGWRCKERLSLEDRQPPDLILCLALVHHLVITGNVPLADVIDWLASFKCEVVIEMLTKQDEMVHKLLLNKTDQYPEFTVEGFEAIAEHYFDVRKKEAVMAERRYLYHLVPKGSS